MTNRFNEFLTKVTSKVKAKDAHSMIKKELTHHLNELSQSFIKSGSASSKDEAEEKAIKEMGNPFTIGEGLNKIHRPKMDWILVAMFAVIVTIGFLPLVGGIPRFEIPGSFFVTRQAIWYSLAIVVIVSFLFFDYRKLERYWMVFYGAGLLFVLVTLMVGRMVNGAKWWLSFPSVGIHIHVAISLLFFFIAWAGILTKINEWDSWKKQGLLQCMFWLPVFLYLLLPNYMLSIIYIFTVVTMFAFSQVRKPLAIRILLASGVIGMFWLMTIYVYASGRQHIINRLSAFITPEADPHGAGYIILVIRDVLAEAGWFGHGLMTGINMEVLPEAHTDFVFPYLVYSLGWAFGIFLCLLLFVFVLRITMNGFKTKDLFGRLIVMGGAAIFTVPIFWNILMGLGVLPIMGVSLPFISYGGSMVFHYGAVLGLVLSVYRKKDIVEPTLVKHG